MLLDRIICPRWDKLCLMSLALFSMTGCTRTTHAVALQLTNVNVVEMEQMGVPIDGQWIDTLDGFGNAGVKAQVAGCAGTRRQAFYSTLFPRKYTFRIMASNNSEKWNRTGTSLDFSVAPAYHQTFWFRSACMIAFLALIAVPCQPRLRQVAGQLHCTEEPINERTRVAWICTKRCCRVFKACC
jgi:hypothetical protein